MVFTYRYDSPMGDLTLVSDGISLTELRFSGRGASELRSDGRKVSELRSGGRTKDREICGGNSMLSVFADTCRWLDIYFAGRDPGFLPQLAPEGTPFRKEVWDLLLGIPFGETTSYGALAAIVAERRAVNGISKTRVDIRVGGTSRNFESYRADGAKCAGGTHLANGTQRTDGTHLADGTQCADGIGRMSAQAIGGAVGHNPIPIIIPCHRVIAADGSIGGFSAGIERKAQLLRMEGIML